MSRELIAPSVRDLEKNRLLGIIEGSAARLIFNLTSGAFLVGFLKYMGASDSMCGYILGIPVLAAVIQFLSPMILECLPSLKKLITAGAMIHRLLLLALIFIPFLPVGTGTRLLFVYLVFFVSYLAFYFVNPAISNLYVSFVPQNIRGSYFGKRESYMLLTSTVVTLILGKIMDNYADAGKEINGYMVLYAVVFIFTLINGLSFFFMREVLPAHCTERIRISEIFTLPLKNKQFVRYFIMLIIWNISSQIANAYFSIYLKSDLNLNYMTITALSLVNSVIYILCTRKWGKFADKNGWSNTTMVTVGILGLCYILWFFCSEGTPYILFLLLLAHIASGIAWSGINISFFNMQFDYTPDEKRTVYIGLSSATSGVIGYLAVAVGCQLVASFGNSTFYLAGRPFNIKQILFLTSGALLLICSVFIKVFMKPKRGGDNLSLPQEQNYIFHDEEEKINV